MNLDAFLSRFAHNAAVIRNLTEDVSAGQARWKPEATEWSILEVINHLYDEERDDFRTRLDLILHHPEQNWPGIDPEGWAIERGYNQRHLAESVANFLAERQKSLTWLGNLSQPNWEQAHQHPNFGPMVAKDMLAAWLAHDWLHIRQLDQLHYQYLAQSHLLRYAGDW